ncbi:MAG TPA: Wzz/FepE/Etk N-terminal domain-containing protein, partial [Pyrinomonadaceae bacterium]|nr:Wzz/FepE/Etk N-terminal domain-containing protein [Pyrinomonadaceae bacterium]
MDKDERLLPLPKTQDLQVSNQDVPSAYSPFYDEESFDERRSLREYFNVVYKRLPLILALTILVTTVAAFYMYRQPSMFSATTTMIIEPRKAKPQDAKGGVNINFGGDVNYMNTQLQILQNPDLMRDVVTRLELYKNPKLLDNEEKGIGMFFRSLFSSEKNAPKKESALPVLSETATTEIQPVEKAALTTEEKALVDRYAGALLGGLSVAQVEKTNLVNLSIISTNPELAAKVADTTADIFIEKDAKRETEGQKKNLDSLTKSIEELENTIAGQEQEFIRYVQSSGLALQDKGNEVRAGNLQTLMEQYNTAKDDRLKIEARFNTAVSANSRGEGTSIPDLNESKIYQEQVRLNNERRAKLQDEIRKIDEKIQVAEVKLDQLRARYNDEWRENQAVIAEIAKLKEQKIKTEKDVTQIIDRDQKKLENESVKGALVGLKSQLDSARVREQKLFESVQLETAKANNQGQAEYQLTTLKNNIATNRDLLNNYKQSQKQQELALEGARPDNLKVSTKAQTPLVPFGPKRERNILIAFLISLAAGIGFAFLLDYLDDSVKTSDDIGRHLGLPTLALIPHQASNTKGNKLSLAKANGNGAGNTTAMIALEDTRSPMAEAYRHLRTSLLFS